MLHRKRRQYNPYNDKEESGASNPTSTASGRRRVLCLCFLFVAAFMTTVAISIATSTSLLRQQWNDQIRYLSATSSEIQSFMAPEKDSCLSDVNTTATLSKAPFPLNCDQSFYQERNKGNLMKNESIQDLDLEHYVSFGRKRGWICTRGQENFRSILNTEIVPNLPCHVLEIGPFLNPTLTVGAPKVKYFDVLDLEGLKARAKEINYPSVHPVPIDYVDSTGDLTNIPNTFSMVLSSHVIEHQLDLVRHLIAVSNLLVEGGYYTVLVPDKRFCFDHFIAESSIADVLDDYYAKRVGAHKLKSVVEHRALTGHNDASRHWNGDDGPQFTENIVARIQAAIAEYEGSGGSYVDVHNYQFTPQSLAFLIDTLYGLRLTNMRVHRVYETAANQLEFCIVLRKHTP